MFSGIIVKRFLRNTPDQVGDHKKTIPFMKLHFVAVTETKGHVVAQLAILTVSHINSERSIPTMDVKSEALSKLEKFRMYIIFLTNIIFNFCYVPILSTKMIF